MADPTRSRHDDGVTVRHEKSNIKQWVFGIAIALLAIIAVQNSQSVEMDFLVIDTEAPLIVALLIAGALGAVIGYAAPVMRRHRRHERKRDRDEE